MLCLRVSIAVSFVTGCFQLTCAAPSTAVSFNIAVDGPDAIFLAGRTDVVIPDASLPWTGPGTHLLRHGLPTPEESKEQFPSSIPVAAGDIIRVLDPAIGGVNFFNGFGPPYFGPGGNGASGSNLNPLDGISGYFGPQGPLTGVFLDDSVPSAGPPPATLNFSAGGLGQDFPSLTPALRQIFYIGDGVTSGGDFQLFTAPAGATRLFLGIPDGFGFGGNPGAYDDNDGGYRVVIGVNEIPQVPEPSTVVLASLATLVAVGMRRSFRSRDTAARSG